MALKLKRELGLFDATLIGIGIIVGAGIYVLIGEAAGVAGNSLWMSFLIGAAISSFTGLSYAELTSMFPQAAAEYVYVKKAYMSKFLAFMIGWLLMCTGILSVSTVSLGFASYFGSLFSVPSILSAIALIVIISYINFRGIKESSNVNIIVTGIELLGLVIIILLAVPKIGSVNYFEMPNGINGVLAASSLIFFAYIGFEDVANIAEETKHPKKVLPRALLLSIVITAILYVLTSVSAVSLANWKDLGNSPAPLALAASKSIGDSAFYIIPFIALTATGSTVLIISIVTSRMIYGMAKEHSLPHKFALLDKKTRTPWVAIIFIMVISSIFALTDKIELVANITSLGAFITFAAINLSLVWLRITRPHLQRPFKVPLSIGNIPILPLIGTIFCLFMIYQYDPPITTVGLIILVLGAAIYHIRKEKMI
jgi:APA family basic amino acid/polyamine antiporter